MFKANIPARSRSHPLRRFVLLALLAVTATTGLAQVKASLVPSDTSVQPGKPLTVAIRLQHEPHWHTYWINPGTGLATTVTWTLPAGWTAGEIQWPAPGVIIDHTGTVTGNGYEGDTLLPVTLTPPANAPLGQTVTIKATVEWLMCADVCKPGSGEAPLTMTVSNNAPPPHPEWGAKIRAAVAGLPRPPDNWAVTASRDAKKITLVVTPAAANPHQVTGLHFFADDNLVAYELPQKVQPDGTGGFVLTLPVSPDAPRDTERLVGVLTSESGWRPDGTLRGLRIDLPFTAPSGAALASAEPAAGAFALGGTLLLAFMGGLILNLMPCVFPVLGIKILGFVNQSGHERGKIIAHGLTFTLGVLVSFWILAGLLSALRAGGEELGWGFQLQSPEFVFVLALFLLVFALNLSGVFEFGLRATGLGGGLQTKSGFTGSFFTGVLATVVATPCAAPFLAPALGAALALSLGKSFLIFTVIGIGLSAPYLLLSLFPGAIRVLPRPGAWMETFKQFMAFPLYATVAFLVWVLAAQVSDNGFLMVLFGLVLAAMGVWFYGRWAAPGARAGRARLGLAAGIVLLGAGLWTGWPQAPEPTDLKWEPWSPAAVEKLRAEGRIVYVDFTARWCATCQTNKQLVFQSDEVLKYFRDHRIAALRADWTNRDPSITAELEKYGRSAVPFNLIWLPEKTDPVILPELLTAGIVLDALQRN